MAGLTALPVVEPDQPEKLRGLVVGPRDGEQREQVATFDGRIGAAARLGLRRAARARRAGWRIVGEEVADLVRKAVVPVFHSRPYRQVSVSSIDSAWKTPSVMVVMPGLRLPAHGQSCRAASFPVGARLTRATSTPRSGLRSNSAACTGGTPQPPHPPPPPRCPRRIRCRAHALPYFPARITRSSGRHSFQPT
jgi:hypothetical protein